VELKKTIQKSTMSSDDAITRKIEGGYVVTSKGATFQLEDETSLVLPDPDEIPKSTFIPSMQKSDLQVHDFGSTEYIPKFIELAPPEAGQTKAIVTTAPIDPIDGEEEDVVKPVTAANTWEVKKEPKTTKNLALFVAIVAMAFFLAR